VRTGVLCAIGDPICGTYEEEEEAMDPKNSGIWIPDSEKQ
jgi:hypothetical protein